MSTLMSIGSKQASSAMMHDNASASAVVNGRSMARQTTKVVRGVAMASSAKIGRGAGEQAGKKSPASSVRVPQATSFKVPETTKAVLTKSIKLPDPIPEIGIERANKLMRNGRIYRYNADSAETCEVSLCEDRFCEYTGFNYSVGLNSCGSAIFLALKCVGVQPGDKVLSNAFTFTAVPSAIVHAGAEPVYVNCLPNYTIDVVDLERKAVESGAKYVVVSHMRGWCAEMDKIADMCDRLDIVMVEDCAHALSVRYKGIHLGHFGKVSCFSSQSYKLLNSGEGGFLATNDDDVAAKAILYAGSYEKLYQKHLRSPPPEAFEDIKKDIPNFSLRMHAVTAAMIRPQFDELDDNVPRYNNTFFMMKERLQKHKNITIPTQFEGVSPVHDSLQMNLVGLTEDQCTAFAALTKERGMPVEIFGNRENARNFINWNFSDADVSGLKQTTDVIMFAADVRLPLQFNDDDFDTMCCIIEDCLDEVQAA